MASFFSGRRISFAAVLESTRSHWVATHSDLPQSSLLCPLLCILYTAELQLSWHPVVLRQQLYADDIFRLSSNGLTSVRPQCSAPWRWWQWDVVQSTAPRRFQNRIYMAELFAATENVFSGHICWLSSHCLLDICLQFEIVPDHRPTFFEHLILFYRCIPCQFRRLQIIVHFHPMRHNLPLIMRLSVEGLTIAVLSILTSSWTLLFSRIDMHDVLHRHRVSPRI